MLQGNRCRANLYTANAYYRLHLVSNLIYSQPRVKKWIPVKNAAKRLMCEFRSAIVG